jgi:putative sigma-54 modulation protein
MYFDIRSGHVNLRSNLREYIEERLDRSLGRMSNRIAHVTVHLDDVNGPKGGADKRCLAEAHLVRSGHIVAEVTAGDVRTAVDLVADRLNMRIRKEIGRRRETRRQGNRRVGTPATA